MQRWFFLEDAKNAALRTTVEDTVKEEVEEELPEQLSMENWNFKVKISNLRSEEVVCLTGGIPELGNWIPERCIILKKTESDIWSINLKIPAGKMIDYRYFVGVIVEENKHVIVRSWETNIHPRNIKVNRTAPQRPQEEPEIYGCYNGQTKIDKGWLIEGTIIQLMMCKQPFKLWRPKYQNRKLHIKITPVNLVRHYPPGIKGTDTADESLSNDHHDDCPTYSYTEVASFNSQDPRFKPQGQFGHKFRDGDLLIFQCYMLNPATTALLIDIYVYSSKAIDDEPPYHAGFSYILPSVFQSSTGNIILPLTSTKQRPLGELKFQYLVIQPLRSFKCDMRATYSRYWNKSKHGLDVGHRGSGSSFKMEMEDSAEIRENTIASLKTAIDHGADYVEFDVQLSKDLVPVIYHDYHVCIAMKMKKTLVESDMYELPIKDLTLEQLRMLKLYHVMEGKTKNPRFFDEDLEEHQPFPTLQSALELLDPKCGFNVEIKWTNKFMDGTYELNDAIDSNLFVNTILDVVLNYGADREIVFSSFNPDICTLVRLKQNKYPVMFLTQGETTKYPHYDDPRCWSIKTGEQFANMMEMLGLSAHTEDILKNPALVEYGLNAGLIMFCWGDDIADPSTIQYLKSLGLHGVIYDKIYQYMEKKNDKDNIYLFNARDSQKELIRMVAQTTEAGAQERAEASTLRSPSAAGNIFASMREESGAGLNMSTATSLVSLESDK